jgi:hypothetical protein
MKTSFDFISDPGHGWVKVPIMQLVRLGIAGKVSSYSYYRRGFAYLEEDCDAGLLMQALSARGLQIKFRERNRAHGYSKIRNYEHYRSGFYL